MGRGTEEDGGAGGRAGTGLCLTLGARFCPTRTWSPGCALDNRVLPRKRPQGSKQEQKQKQEDKGRRQDEEEEEQKEQQKQQ